MDSEALYLKLPIFAQQLACSFEGWRIQRTRFGPGFARALREAEERWKWDAARFENFRDERVRDMVRHAYRTTSFYRRAFDEQGIKPDSIRGLGDLYRLPIVGKSDVQQHIGDMTSDLVPSSQQISIHTSGTTGGGLRFTTTQSAVQEQWATWWRYRRLHGLVRLTWCGYFGGRSVVPLSQQRPPYWRINQPGHQILFSAYHLSPHALPNYIAILRERQPPWLHGYPSVLAVVATFMIERGLTLGYTPTHITTGAENLLPQQAAVIERAFGVAPLQHYGMAEAVANFSLCRQGRFHVDEDFAAVEFVPIPGILGHRVIGTNLTNLATPLLRYDVGDVVDLGEEQCDCGLPGRVVRSVDGRQEDHIVLRNGARLGRMDHIFKDMTAVREAQLYQNAPGVIRVRLVRNAWYGEKDEAMLLAEFRKRLGDEAEVKIDYVDQLSRTPRGKLRFVVSEIPESVSSV
jgi:phenylacetate-CoA ligase